ncbi:MAG: type I methionyl aminopeptidase [Patescibacteria group bacterium]|nr:type I methionyl aminopeptidase [Patescibacteria group bacterium]MDE1945840.1 type I methionyl aminopeptidase [Patescibacteria group bacterium]
MITIKTPEEIKILREGGRRLAAIMQALRNAAKIGVSTADLDALAEKMAREGGDVPSLLGYRPKGAKRPYPASVCISVNDEVVHGIPNEHPKILANGDIVSFDMCLTHRGLITDTAATVVVGAADAEAEKLVLATEKALFAGIKAVKGGGHIGDIGYAVERVGQAAGFGVVEELCGHGVGYKVHEDPYVPNFGRKGSGEKLKPGMVLAIEPMFTAGSKNVYLDDDGYTYKTADGSRAAHFEHTIVITAKGVEILTEV